MIPFDDPLRLAGRLVDACPSPALLVEAGGRLRAANRAAALLLGLDGGGAEPTLRDLVGIGWREVELIAREGDTDLAAELPPGRSFPDRRGARVRFEPVAAADGRLGGVVAFLEPVAEPAPTSRRAARTERGFDAIFGDDPAVLATKEAAARFARTLLPVLLLAETGTGKELLARAIHGASARRDRPFVAINCGALSPHLLESELFGYAPGAFTGASRDGNDGKIGAARGGTLFLDEVAEMPGPLQALLLRVLEDGTYYRVGDNRPRQADVRLVCATCLDLPGLVAEGAFRRDLFYRIEGACLGLPPLRARSDLPALIGHLLGSLAAEAGRPAPELAPEVFATLTRAAWPGNVRQLKTALQHALILCDGATIRREHLPRELGGGVRSAPPHPRRARARRAGTRGDGGARQPLARGRGARNRALDALPPAASARAPAVSSTESPGGRPSRARAEPTGESRIERRARVEHSQRTLQPRLVLLTLAGFLLFGYPFLAVFSGPHRVAGIPALYFWLFLAWGLFILAIARLVDPGGRRR